MLLKLKDLYKVIEKLYKQNPDMLFGSMLPGQKDIVLFAPKRFIVAKDNLSDNKFLIINNMGTHWTKEYADSQNLTTLSIIEKK